MNTPHTKWFDLANREQCDWALSYLWKKDFRDADRTFLEILMSSRPDADIKGRFRNKTELQLLRLQMERAWRVRCSRVKNSRQNPRSVSISVASRRKLKELADRKQQSVSMYLNDLIEDVSKFAADVERDVDKQIREVKQKYSEKLQRATDRNRSKTIAMKTSVGKRLGLQQELLCNLQEQIETLAKKSVLLEVLPEGSEELVAKKADTEKNQKELTAILDVVKELLDGTRKIQEKINLKDELEQEKLEREKLKRGNGQGIAAIYGDHAFKQRGN